MTKQKSIKFIRTAFVVLLSLKVLDLMYRLIKGALVGHADVLRLIASRSSDITSILLFVCIIIIIDQKGSMDA